MFLIMRLLGLRARRAGAFVGGGYEPIDAGPDACAFVRGGDVLVVVELRPAASGAALRGAPGGRWRDVLSGEERSFSSNERVSGLVGDAGVGVFERL
jgi:maltooligosyltrehalose synthase